jgi:flavin-dependent dehydrogenase
LTLTSPQQFSVRVKRIRCTWNMGDPVDAEVAADEALWMVRRDEFDYFLVQQAQRQGAELWAETKAQSIAWQGDRWQVATSRGPVDGRYLIAADGGRGVMAKWLGFTQRRHLLAAAVEIEPRVTMPTDPLLYLEMGMVQYGYLWNFSQGRRLFHRRRGDAGRRPAAAGFTPPHCGVCHRL